MKKYLRNLICLMICLLSFLGSADAAKISIADAKVVDGSATVSLSETDLSTCTKVVFEFQPSVAMTIKFNPNSSYSKTGYEVTGESYMITNTAGLSAGDIGTVTFTVPTTLTSTFTITPVNVHFYKADGTEHTSSSVDAASIKYEAPKSNNATLTALSVSQGELSPAFASNVKEYTLTVPDTLNTIKLTATAAAGATRTGTGNKTLVMGENVFEIVVTAEDGNTKQTYTVTVNRGEVKGPSAYLISLIINNIGCALSPEFDTLNNKYTVDVGKDIEELDFKYELEEPAATVTIDGNKNFVDGENLVTITVEASDKSSKQIYEIVVNKNMTESTEESTEEVVATKKKPKVWLIILIVIIILAIVAGVTFILFKKKGGKGKPGKKDNKKKDEKPLVEEETEGVGEGITQVLEEHFYDDEKTTTYKKETFKLEDEPEDEDKDFEKTKEFNFKDFN